MDINGGFSSTPCLITGGDCRRDSGFGPKNEAFFIGERRNKSWEQTCILWPNNEVVTCSISFQFYCIYILYIYIIIICYDVFFCDIFRFGHGSKIVGWFHAFGVLFVCCPVMLDRCFVGGVPDFSSLTEATVLETSATSSHRGLSRSGVAGAKEVWLRWDFKVNVKQMMV